MATVIPVKGEMKVVACPMSESEARAHFDEWVYQDKLGLRWDGELKTWAGADESFFLFRDPVRAFEASWEQNPRANTFIMKRSGGSVPPAVFGTVLYLSGEEKKTFLSSLQQEREAAEAAKASVAPKETDAKATRVPLFGDTYPSKDEIRIRFGGRWDPKSNAWTVEKHLAAEAQALVNRRSRSATSAEASQNQRVVCSKCLRDIPLQEASYLSVNGVLVPSCGPEEREECELIQMISPP